MSRDRFDLHVHSTASDGVLPPREVVALAAERGLAGIALTDHDTVDGVAEAMGMGAALDVRVIPGVELSCSGPHSRQIHLLGYLVDPENEVLGALFERMRAERVERAAAIVHRVADIAGSLTMDDVLEESGDAPPGRPHIARAMTRLGIVDHPDEAFSVDWFGPGGRAFVHRDGIAVDEAIAAVHAAGGVAVFAHPCSRRPDGLPEAAVRHAASVGLDGIEVDHPRHEGEHVEQCSRIARELGLVETAGSDDHGTGADGPRLGCRTVPASVIAALEARAAMHR